MTDARREVLFRHLRTITSAEELTAFREATDADLYRAMEAKANAFRGRR